MIRLLLRGWRSDTTQTVVTLVPAAVVTFRPGQRSAAFPPTVLHGRKPVNLIQVSRPFNQIVAALNGPQPTNLVGIRSMLAGLAEQARRIPGAADPTWLRYSGRDDPQFDTRPVFTQIEHALAGVDLANPRVTVRKGRFSTGAAPRDDKIPRPPAGASHDPLIAAAATVGSGAERRLAWRSRQGRSHVCETVRIK
jgi:hypothetical protein